MTSPFDNAALAQLRLDLIRKALRAVVLYAPSTAAGISPTTLFDPTSGELTPAGFAGYYGLGVITTAGTKFSESVTSTDLQGMGFLAPVRSDITKDTDTMVVEPMETNDRTIGLYSGTDPTTYTYGTNGVLAVAAPPVRAGLRYRVLVLAKDDAGSGDIIIGRYYPSMQVTNINDQSYDNGADNITWGVTMTAYVDSVAGFAKEYLFGGAGWKALQDGTDDPRTITVTTTTVSTGSPPLNTVLIVTTGTVSTDDIGRTVTGSGIPTGTTILSIQDSTHPVISAAATAIATAVPVTIN